MAYIHNAVYNRMTTFSPLVTLVSTRIYHIILPQAGAYPALTYQGIGTRHIQDYQGKGGLASSLFQFDSYSTDTNQNAAISEALRHCFQGWATVFSGVTITGSIARLELDAPFDPDAQLHRVTHQYEFWHNETEP